MSVWKKTIITSICLVVLAIFPVIYYVKYYTETPYYVRVSEESRIEDALDSKGVRQGNQFEYSLEGYDKSGGSKEIDFAVYRVSFFDLNGMIFISINGISCSIYTQSTKRTKAKFALVLFLYDKLSNE